MAVQSAKGVFTGGDGDALAPGVGALGEATEAAGGFRRCGTGIRVGHGSRRGRVLRGGDIVAEGGRDSGIGAV